MKRIPGTMFLPDDIGEIEWLDEPPVRKISRSRPASSMEESTEPFRFLAPLDGREPAKR